MIAELDRHPHARSVLAGALQGGAGASHAYLFHGPGGAGKRGVARALAASLLSDGVSNPASAHARALSGAHPDLTWVAPSGAHEMLVSDVAEPVIAAVSKTPFESSKRVFVIERVDELGDEAANRMLKTLEEPPEYVHLILVTDRLAEVLPTIRSRCQLVRFDAPPLSAVVDRLLAGGTERATAEACARLALGDAAQALELCTSEGAALRASGERFARVALAGSVASAKPWSGMLAAVKARGELVRLSLEDAMAAELQMTSRKEQTRVKNEWGDRIKRGRRRTETASLDAALQIASLWFSDLACLSWGAADLVRATDRRAELQADLDALGESGAFGDGAGLPQALLAAVDLVEETRRRFQLNVTEELACEALAYRLERQLSL